LLLCVPLIPLLFALFNPRFIFWFPSTVVIYTLLIGVWVALPWSCSKLMISSSTSALPRRTPTGIFLSRAFHKIPCWGLPSSGLISINACRLNSPHTTTTVTMTHRSQDMRQPGLVTINGFEQLSSLFSELQARPDLASQIKALEYKNDNDEDEEDEEADDVEQELEAAREAAQASIAAKRAQCYADLTFILEQITQRGQLESFEWSDGSQAYDDVEARPASFWTALSGAASTLKHFSLQFTTHELHKLVDTVSIAVTSSRALLMSSVDAVPTAFRRTSNATT
jgi:hypothetical protein